MIGIPKYDGSGEGKRLNKNRGECNMMDLAKETVGVGVVGVAGHGIMGSMVGLPGMPAGTSGVAGITGTGLQLASIGQLAKIGMGVAGMFETATGKNGKKTSSKEVNKILGL